MTPTLRPFFTYYGGKWSTAPRYQPPRHDLVIEPFAGSAGYSVRLHARRVLLADLNEQVIGTWRYLIAASADEIRTLPLLAVGQCVYDLPVCQEARWLIGWWTNKGAASPHISMSAWGRVPAYASQFWGERVRERLARQVDHIRDWTAVQIDYQDLPDHEATWFIDPPYSGKAGRRYPHNAVDYPALADWCKARPGQVIVCEQEGADWLPFEPLHTAKATVGSHKTRSTCPEVAWQR